MNATKRVLPLSWCVNISSAALGWAMSLGSNESRSLLSSLKGLPISVKTWNNVSTLSRKTCCAFGVCSWWFVCTTVSLASEAIVLGKELADFGTSYHPPYQCWMILGHANDFPVGLVMRLIYDLCTTNAHIWNAWASWGCFSPSVDMYLRWMRRHRV